MYSNVTISTSSASKMTNVNWPCARCGKTTENTQRELFMSYRGLPMAYIHTKCRELDKLDCLTPKKEGFNPPGPKYF